MDYNITYRDKDKGIQAIVSYKQNGKWKQKSKQGFNKKGDAKTWAQNTIDNLKETFEADLNLELAGTTYEELYGMAIKHFNLYKELGTIMAYDVANTHFGKLNKKNITEITSIDIQDCVDEMVKKGLQPITITGYMARIRKVFDYAIDPHKIIKVNPVISVTMPTDKDKKKKEIKALTVFELEDLLSKIKNPKYKFLSLVAATCGLRIGEITGLTWDCIDEKNATMTINKQWKVVEKKPLKYGIGKVKSVNSNRTIPIPTKTMAALLKYKAEYPININGRLFPYTRNDSLCNALLKYYRRRGYSISVHDLRHTYASRLVANGVDFKTVAELMGDTVQMVINTYSHFNKDMFDKAKKAVNNIF